MENNLNFYVEKTENSVFVVVEFDSFEQLINYQVKMLINNKIKYLLSASLQQIDGKIKLYYDITNKISLKNYVSNNKLSQIQFIAILNSLIRIDDEIDEFQLINSGIVFDLKWAFVDTNGENIEYIYIPNATDVNDASDIKNFIMDIMISGGVSSTAQLLVTNLYTMLQDNNVSMRDIKDIIYKFEGRGNSLKINKKVDNSHINENIEIPQSPIGDDIKKQYSIPKISQKPDIKNKKEEKNNNKNKKKLFSKKTKEKEETDMQIDNKTTKSTKHITFAIVFDLLVVALIYKGYESAFFEKMEMGNNVYFVFVIIIVLVDILIFRLFKPKDNIQQSSGKIDKKTETSMPNIKKPQMAQPKMTMPDTKIPQMIQPKMAMPSAKIPQMAQSKSENVGADINIDNSAKLHNRETTKLSDEINIPFDTKISDDNCKINNANINSELENDKTVLMKNDFDIENDETVLMATNEPIGYIERFENNEVVDKYIIKKDSVVIGRLRSQVDMTILNPKVGKIHAEICRKDKKFYIKDLNSKNGVYINNSKQRIEPDTECEIFDGDSFRLADSEFKIHFIK